MAQLSCLLGKTIREIEKSEDQIDFILATGEHFRMHHVQDCCENVYIEDIIGDLEDLKDSPITKAEESTDTTCGARYSYDDSCTWTFYNLATVKGYVTIRWYGGSNGYYSESVDFVQI